MPKILYYILIYNLERLKKLFIFSVILINLLLGIKFVFLA